MSWIGSKAITNMGLEQVQKKTNKVEIRRQNWLFYFTLFGYLRNAWKKYSPCFSETFMLFVSLDLNFVVFKFCNWVILLFLFSPLSKGLPCLFSSVQQRLPLRVPAQRVAVNGYFFWPCCDRAVAFRGGVGGRGSVLKQYLHHIG